MMTMTIIEDDGKIRTCEYDETKDFYWEVRKCLYRLYEITPGDHDWYRDLVARNRFWATFHDFIDLGVVVDKENKIVKIERH